jgi:NAD(P)-dependent dehydrogenase (short-subunit alcohol dehydrogenase family)
MGSNQVLSRPVWLITGSTGIAAATARLAVERTYRVFLWGLEEDPTRELADQLGSLAAWGAGDLRQAETAETAIAGCVERFGQIDSLFNVAGGSGRSFGDGPTHECTVKGWEETIALNLSTLFHMSRAVLPHMMSRRKGSILQMATVTAFSPEPRHFATHAYAAAKGGVIALTKAMASYYAQYGIRVNALAPGLVRTPMSRRAQSDEGILEFMKTKQPLAQGLIEPDDIARTAAHFLDDDSRFVTGQVLAIDAGWQLS